MDKLPDNIERWLNAAESWRRVREEAVEVLEGFGAETPVTVRFLQDSDRLWAIAALDDDDEAVVIWNQMDSDGFSVVRQVWLTSEVVKAIVEFSKQNVKAQTSPTESDL